MSGAFKDVMTQAEVEREIERLYTDLETETERIVGLGIAMGETEVAFKTARAKAHLKAEGAEHLRTATIEADEEVMGLLLQRRIAEAQYEGQREKLRTMRTQIEALRSINVNAREAIG